MIEPAIGTVLAGVVAGRRLSPFRYEGVDSDGATVVLRLAELGTHDADRLRREHEVLAVGHPGTERVVRLAEDSGWLVSVRRFHGLVLVAVPADIVRRDAAALKAEVRRALAALHGIGWKHGALSAAAVLVANDGTVLLTNLADAAPADERAVTAERAAVDDLIDAFALQAPFREAPPLARPAPVPAPAPPPPGAAPSPGARPVPTAQPAAPAPPPLPAMPEIVVPPIPQPPSSAPPAPAAPPGPAPAWPAAPAPAAPPSPAPAARPPVPGAAPPPEARQSAVRWFSRMNPHRIYPLTVALTSSTPSMRAGPRTSVAIGRRPIPVDSEDPYVEIEPLFAGCLISPSKARVDLRQPQVTVRFFLTPIAEGDLKDARVEIRSSGAVVDTIATPSVVASRRIARLLAVVGAVAPFVGLEGESQKQLSESAGFLESMSPVGASLAVTALAGLGAVGVWYATRAQEADADPA